jgi:hypothetical protein
MLNRTVTEEESWAHHTNPNRTVLQRNRNIPNSPSNNISWQGYACRVLDSQEELLAHFQKHGENANAASYCEVLLKLLDTIRRKRPSQLARGVLLHHDNVRPHTARATEERFQELQWELLEHSPYRPDLAPSDIHMFGLLKNHHSGKGLADDEEVEAKVWK